MSNPSVTAIIGVDDKASPKLRELAELTRKTNTVAKNLNGVGADRYANSLRHATAAAREHLGVMQRVQKLHHAVLGSAAGYGLYRATHIALSRIKDYLPYQKEVQYQGAIQHYTKPEMGLLERQRVKAAVDLGIAPMDTLHAQMQLVQRNLSASIVEAGTGVALTLSRALNIPAEKAAEITEGLTFSRNIHPHNAVDAKREFGRSADLAAAAAKAGAMTPEDIELFGKYAFGISSAANISPEQALAVGMTLKRANVRGDEAGVFQRQLAARMIAPTAKGQDALAAMGIDVSQYATQGTVSVDSIDKALKRRQGKGLGDKGRRSLEKAFEDGKALETREGFANAVREALSGEKLSRTDLKNTVKAAVTQYDLAKSGFRGGDLMDAIFSKATTAQLQAFIGDKQGARATMLLQAVQQYQEYVDKLKGAEGFASGIAKERLEGLAAAADRLTASLDVASKSFVAANEGWLTPLTEAGAKLAGFAAGLDNSSKAAISLGAGITGIAGLATVASTIATTVAGLGSLTASANLAAASLSRIAAGGAVGTAATAAGAAGGAAGGRLTRGAIAVGGFAARAYLPTMIALGLYEGLNLIEGPPVPNPEADSNYAKWKWDNALKADERRSKQNALSSFIAGYTAPPVAPSEQRVSSLRALGLTDDQVIGNSNPTLASGRVNVKGGGSFGDVSVTGTVTGSAEMFQHFTFEMKPTPYFESLVQRADQASRMTLNGQLGTGGHGPGDNSVKPSAAPTGVQ